jgi:hypothetical protein
VARLIDNDSSLMISLLLDAQSTYRNANLLGNRNKYYSVYTTFRPSSETCIDLRTWSPKLDCSFMPFMRIMPATHSPHSPYTSAHGLETCS